jgi:glycosyltransferase involved in cell wall biosynthesis
MLIRPNIDLGAAIIAKNSASSIEKLILHLQTFCKQIVVVDTGSEDDTAKIATRCGAEVHFCSWQSSFSLARNYSISLMRTDWIICVDTDELIDKQSIDDSSFLFLDEEIGGIMVNIENILGPDDNSPRSIHTYTRIFRNDKRFYFSGRIHEQIRPSIENAGFKIADSKILIKHSGYNKESISKYQRNLELLKLDLEDNPNDDFVKFHLANTYFALKDFDAAKYIYTQLFKDNSLTQEQNEMVRIKLAQLALSADNPTDVKFYTDFVSGNTNIEGLRLFILASSCLAVKQFAAAKELFGKEELQLSSMVDNRHVEAALQILNKIPGI